MKRDDAEILKKNWSPPIPIITWRACGARTIAAFLKGYTCSLAGVPSVESFHGDVSLALPDSIAAGLGAGAPFLPFGPLAIH